MTILDGKQTAVKIKEEVASTLDGYYSKGLPRCRLAIVMVGNNPASEVYVRNKTKACEASHIECDLIRIDEDITQSQLNERMYFLGIDERYHGILLQLPLPAHLNEDEVIDLVPYHKDVDGFTVPSLGALASGKDGFLSCTPGGIMYMLKSYNVPLVGKHAVVIGRSKIVGKPMALALLNESCTVTVCHSKTQNIKDICRKADIIVAAVGKPLFVTADMVKEGAVVVDVGINRTEQGLKGDVDFENVKDKCSFITPVPGGVGPMTVAYLMHNTLRAYEKCLDIK